MKEFYGSISFSGRINFSTKAENEEQVKDILYDKISLDITSEDKKLEIVDIEWDLISREPRGNVATPFVRDIEIFKES